MTNGDRNWNSSFMNEFWDHVEGWRPDWHCFCPKLDISKIKFLCSNPTVTWSSKTARGFQMRKNISASGFCSGIQQTQQRAKIERKRKRPLFIKCIFTWCPNKIVLWTKNHPKLSLSFELSSLIKIFLHIEGFMILQNMSRFQMGLKQQIAYVK